jgi:hypothetical protein
MFCVSVCPFQNLKPTSTKPDVNTTPMGGGGGGGTPCTEFSDFLESIKQRDGRTC